MDVELAALTVRFPTRTGPALDGVDVTIASGERVALLGASGAGKTTLLRALVGGVEAAPGQVRVGGLDPHADAATLRRVRRATGVIRQAGDLVVPLRGRTNAVLGTGHTWRVRDVVRILRGATPERWRDRLEQLADEHGVGHLLDVPVRELSGGQRQRIALLRALLPGPGLLLADEPTAGLDPPAAAAAVDALCGVDGVTTVVTTHDLGVARRFPRIVALRDGRVAHDAPALDDATVARVYGGSPRAGGGGMVTS